MENSIYQHKMRTKKSHPKNIQRTPNFMFVRRVIRSCNTLEELSMAEKMIWQFATIVHKDDFKSAYDLQNIHDKKKLELEEMGMSALAHIKYQEQGRIQKRKISMNKYKAI